MVFAQEYKKPVCVRDFVPVYGNQNTLDFNIFHLSEIIGDSRKITAQSANLTRDPNFKNISGLPFGFVSTYGVDLRFEIASEQRTGYSGF